MLFIKYRNNQNQIKHIFNKRFTQGFTLVEMMVATTLFSVIVMGSITVMFTAQNSYKKISQNRIIIDNLNIVMDAITREIRYGSNYSCIGGSNFDNLAQYNENERKWTEKTGSLKGEECKWIAYTPNSTTTKKIVYFLEKPPNSDIGTIKQSEYSLEKRGESLFWNQDNIYQMVSDNFIVTYFNLKVDNSDSYQIGYVDIYMCGKINKEKTRSDSRSENDQAEDREFCVQSFASKRNIE